MNIAYFELLGLPSSFALDEKALEAAYFAAQRQTHPDRFAGKPEAERLTALQRSVDINQAYETLKNPLKHAQYLLHLQGIRVGTEQDSVKPSAGLLMETMEWRERVAEAKDQDTLNALDNELANIMSRSIKILANTYLYTQWDAMAQETLRLGYIMKAREAVAQQKIRLKKQAS